MLLPVVSLGKWIEDHGKKGFYLLLEVCRILTHCFCPMVNRKKILRLIANLGNVRQFFFRLKNNFLIHDWLLALCIYIFDEIRYLITY